MFECSNTSLFLCFNTNKCWAERRFDQASNFTCAFSVFLIVPATAGAEWTTQAAANHIVVASPRSCFIFLSNCEHNVVWVQKWKEQRNFKERRSSSAALTWQLCWIVAHWICSQTAPVQAERRGTWSNCCYGYVDDLW